MGTRRDTEGIKKTLDLEDRNVRGVLELEGIGALGEWVTVRILGLGGIGEAIGNRMVYREHWDCRYGNNGDTGKEWGVVGTLKLWRVSMGTLELRVLGRILVALVEGAQQVCKTPLIPWHTRHPSIHQFYSYRTPPLAWGGSPRLCLSFPPPRPHQTTPCSCSGSPSTSLSQPSLRRSRVS